MADLPIGSLPSYPSAIGSDLLVIVDVTNSVTKKITKSDFLAGDLTGALLASNNLSDVASASTARTNLGLAIGSNVQAWSANLNAWSAIGTASKLNSDGTIAMTGNLDLGGNNAINVNIVKVNNGGGLYNLANNAHINLEADGHIDFTGTGISATTVPYLDASKNLVSSSVTPTELGYLSGVTSAIQTQLNAKVTGSGTSSGTNTGDQTITLTGESTGSGTGSFAVTLTNSAVIGKVLTGYTSGPGTVAATDTILQAIQKLNGNDALKASLSGAVFTGPVSFSGTTNSGLQVNSLTTTQRDALTASAGMIIWNSSTLRYDFYNGSGWKNHVRLDGDTMTGDLAITPSSALSDGTSALSITATMPSAMTAANNAVNINITGNGATGFATRAMTVNLLAGAGGANNTIAGTFTNVSTAGGNLLVSGGGNFGILATSTGIASAGFNFGVRGLSSGGINNTGVVGVSITAKNSGTNIGGAFFGNNSGTSPIQVGVYAGLDTADPTFVSSALLVDNYNTTSPIAVFRDNGTAVLTIADGGGVSATSISTGVVPLNIRGFGAAGSYTQSGDLLVWQSYDGTTATTLGKITKDGFLRAPNGSQAGPSISFNNATGTGFYWSGTNVVFAHTFNNYVAFGAGATSFTGNILPDTTNVRLLADETSSAWAAVSTRALTSDNALVCRTRDIASGNSFAATYRSGTGGAGGSSGLCTVQSGAGLSGGNSGDLRLLSGSASNGSLQVGNTGNIYINPGDSTGVLPGTVGNFGLFTVSGSFGTGQRVGFVANAFVNPSATPTGGYVFYSSGARAMIREDVNRYIVQAAAATKITASAPYTNDGYVVMTINGTDYKVMTTA